MPKLRIKTKESRFLMKACGISRTHKLKVIEKLASTVLILMCEDKTQRSLNAQKNIEKICEERVYGIRTFPALILTFAILTGGPLVEHTSRPASEVRYTASKRINFSVHSQKPWQRKTINYALTSSATRRLSYKDLSLYYSILF